MSSFVIVHVALSPNASATGTPRLRPTDTRPRRRPRSPSGPDSDSVVGARAHRHRRHRRITRRTRHARPSDQSRSTSNRSSTAVPPSSFTTCFTNVNDAGMSSFVIVHVADSPNASVDRRARLTFHPHTTTPTPHTRADPTPTTHSCPRTPALPSPPDHPSARSRPWSARSRSTSNRSRAPCRRRRSRPASPTSTTPGCRRS